MWQQNVLITEQQKVRKVMLNIKPVRKIRIKISLFNTNTKGNFVKQF